MSSSAKWGWVLHQQGFSEAQIRLDTSNPEQDAWLVLNPQELAVLGTWYPLLPTHPIRTADLPATRELSAYKPNAN